jgi:hypothetical protein
MEGVPMFGAPSLVIREKTTMWNPLKKKSISATDDAKSKDPTKPGNMGFLARMAMKRFEKMTPEQQEEVIKKTLDPNNIQKNKKKILEMFDAMEKSGQMNKHQVFEAKKRLGLL